MTWDDCNTAHTIPYIPVEIPICALAKRGIESRNRIPALLPLSSSFGTTHGYLLPSLFEACIDNPAEKLSGIAMSKTINFFFFSLYLSVYHSLFSFCLALSLCSNTIYPNGLNLFLQSPISMRHNAALQSLWGCRRHF